ncbi:phosphotransferase [Nonomuraea sp. NPDC026600]|uniref:phosphotransferase n=1 Tax=Nonomuraea sp. NPDC026600 TaxID=3155363 RepID=UPI0034048968
MTTPPATVPATVPAACEEAALRQRLHRLCPGVIGEEPAIRTETSLLLPGRLGARPVIAKQPTDRRPFWVQRCLHEIAVYRALEAAGPPPVPLPELVAADPETPIVVVTRLPGDALGPDRYPATPPPPERVDLLLACLARMHAWRPTGGIFPVDDDYPAQYARLGPLFTPDDLACVARLHHQVTHRLTLRIAHGDAHLGNALLHDDAVALIDLEFTAWRPPGFDQAKLWVLLGDHPQAQARLRDVIPADPWHQAAFWLAAALICGRELRSHQRMAARQQRLARLAADLHVSLHALHRSDLA